MINTMLAAAKEDENSINTTRNSREQTATTNEAYDGKFITDSAENPRFLGKTPPKNKSLTNPEIVHPFGTKGSTRR